MLMTNRMHNEGCAIGKKTLENAYCILLFLDVRSKIASGENSPLKSAER